MAKIRKSLVISAGGFLGRALCRRLVATGHAVSCVVRQKPANWGGPYVPVAEMEGLKDEFTEVYLVAAAIPYGKLDQFSAELNTANIALPLRVVAQFPRARLVYASSVSVYGRPLHLPMDEDHPFNCPSAYALSKLAGEVAVRAHPNHAVLRLPSLYGPGMTPATFLPAIVRQAREAGRITLAGDGSRCQDYLQVDAAAIMLAMAAESTVTGVFNAVSGQPVSNLEAARTVAELVGAVEIVFAGEDAIPSGIYADSRWREAFGEGPKIALHDGLKELLRHG